MLALPHRHGANETGRRKSAEVVTRRGVREAGDTCDLGGGHRVSRDHPEYPQAQRVRERPKPDVENVFQRNVGKLAQNWVGAEAVAADFGYRDVHATARQLSSYGLNAKAFVDRWSVQVKKQA
jgi:hypothetical protein